MENISERLIDQRKERIFLGAKYQISETSLVIWRFLCAYIDQCGYAPSLREIAEGCHISTTAAVNHLHCLDERGYIHRPVGHYARAIQLVTRPE